MTKNYVEIIGFVGQDPKLNTQNAPVRLSMATTERWRDTKTREERAHRMAHRPLLGPPGEARLRVRQEGISHRRIRDTSFPPVRERRRQSHGLGDSRPRAASARPTNHQ